MKKCFAEKNMMVVVDNDLNLYDMEIYLLKIRGYKA